MVVKPKPLRVEISTIRRGLFEETLSTDGKVRSRNKKTIYALASGNLIAYSAKAGDLVKKNQVITTLLWGWDVKVKSPIDGIITKIYRDSGGPIQRGDPIFEVASMNDLEVVSEVLTPDAIRLSQNGEAKIANWGGEIDIKARISKISRAANVKISALGVEEERTEVILSLEKTPPIMIEKFGDNYHVDVIFIISKTTDVISVPLGALFKKGDSWSVYVVQNGIALSREIKISKRNDQEAIVTSGLAEGERVILFPGDKVYESVKVKE